MIEALFWTSVVGILYPYVGYPLVLLLLGGVVGRRKPPVGFEPFLPSVSIVIPVHNEEATIERKIANTKALRYPADRLQVLFVSDGSTDRTVEIIRSRAASTMTVVELPIRRGKAAALNAGLDRAEQEILVFSDATIELELDALYKIVRQFRDPQIGCISGEDRIAESGGEAWYGRYELFLRRQESKVFSIVGASGSFYAQRRTLCGPFVEGTAPDFLSVLRTVEQGFVAVTEPEAVGSMTSVKDPKQEFERKVRTLIRGMTTLFGHGRVLNPFRFGVFSFEVLSHKVMRWLVPFFLVTLLLSPLGLLDSPWYLTAFVLQAAFYLVALATFAEWGPLRHSFLGKIMLYFSTVNAAILAAWVQYGRGIRQELWTPSRR